MILIYLKDILIIMFTGIIERTGIVRNIEKSSRNCELTIEVTDRDFLNDIQIGSSIAVNGVCLTVTSLKNNRFCAFISTETYNITALKEIKVGETANLEKSLKVSDRLDGHIVLGHVDDVGIITGLYKMNQDYKLEIRIPARLLKYTVIKGSIAINGISLTIASKKSDRLSFSIIPETYNRTNIPLLKSGSKVNIEVDLFAKYVENFKK